MHAVSPGFASRHRPGGSRVPRGRDRTTRWRWRSAWTFAYGKPDSVLTR